MTITLPNADVCDRSLPFSDSAKEAISLLQASMDAQSADRLQRTRLVVLTHYLPPYMGRVLQHVARVIPNTKVLLSIPLEPNRSYALDWGSLDVQVQKSLMLRRRWKHRAGFNDELYVHMPYDTYSQLRATKPDLIFSYELGFRSLASALYRRLHSQTRLAYCVCVSEHTEAGRGGARWLLRKTLIRLADAITYNGPSCRSYLRQLGVPDSKLFHFPYAADDRTEPPLRDRISEPNRRLLVIGQLNERKGVMQALEAVSAYANQHPDQSWDLTFVGSGPLQDDLKNYRAAANLTLHVLGSIDPIELAPRLNDYGVLLFPTLADEWGLVVNEAMRAGLPVLGSCYAQASNTLIDEGRNGWVYAPDRPEQLHEKLARIYQLTNRKMVEMRDHARGTVAHITSQSVAAAACQMFERLRG
ncbi:MAG: glycosyltransferase family 4 protein [Pirellulaceae bacterium]|nr:glycosyltransferase family 4 protein [Pirellulaceae bacterium]